MTFLESLKQATDDAGFKGLSFANLQEFNAFMDSFQFEEWPRNIVVPFNTTGRIVSNRIKSTLILQGWALTRIAQDTNDWRSVQLEPLYMEPMRERVRQFFISLVNSDIVDSEVTDVSFSTKPEYAFLAAHLFGVSYTISLPITQKLC